MRFLRYGDIMNEISLRYGDIVNEISLRYGDIVNEISFRYGDIVNEISLRYGDIVLSDVHDVVDCRSKEFSKNFSSQRVESVDLVQKAVCDHPSLDHINIDIDVVRKVLLNKNNSAAGLDGILGIFYRKLAYALAIPLCIVFQQSIFQHNIPDMWRLAIITPLYKGKGDQSMASLYRPISLADVASKLHEKLVVMQITSFLVENNLI